jgi:hypothetical protein
MGDLGARVRTAALARCTLYALLDHHIFGPKGPAGGVTGSIPVAPNHKSPAKSALSGRGTPQPSDVNREGVSPKKLGETFAECSSG